MPRPRATELDVVVVREKSRTQRHVVSMVAVVACTAIVGVCGVLVARALAGRHTYANISIAASLVISVPVAWGLGAQYRKIRAQANEIERLRDRIGQLETAAGLPSSEEI